MKIYLDNCCYNRPFDVQNQDLVRLETQAKLIIQQRIRDGFHSHVWSFMSDAENDENLSEDKRNAIGIWRNIAEEYCGASEDILEKAREYMKLGMRHKDAVHLACAVKCKCDYFITTDKKFLNKNKYVEEIEIVNPMIFILETEGER